MSWCPHCRSATHTRWHHSRLTAHGWLVAALVCIALPAIVGLIRGMLVSVPLVGR